MVKRAVAAVGEAAAATRVVMQRAARPQVARTSRVGCTSLGTWHGRPGHVQSR